MPEHYFSSKPASAEREIVIKDRVRGNYLTLYSAPSVFSKDHIDPGSRLLAQRCKIDSSMSVLDLGCGYGIVGIAVAKAFPGVRIVATDINERACELTKRNATENGVAIDVRCGNLYDRVPESFDAILLNPPQTAGKAVCFAMIDLGRAHLKPGGAFYLAARPAKGGKTLAARMAERIGAVDVVGRAAGYAVYRSTSPL
ncbi:class I SAM-dependent methyltransferase [Candidatus Woesearchaeota archaeon]|nr:class I SAM-dependent methyltransferase [Candidatus Woesearchaeota archaeon]